MVVDLCRSIRSLVSAPAFLTLLLGLSLDYRSVDWHK